ncbi:store-operated calcium entry-associated regulatory factor-like [Ornithodoros turicata]|uniref:store-operated calcium entry-associated regulatory factor-like n=1 Tax=Ornithodoros turicata TaxID=34597 RepID=UPI003139726F
MHFFSRSLILVVVLSLLRITEGQNKVKLKDVSTLTLHSGRMTTGRRTSPVPQLKCIGGSAGCTNTPHVVQCYNRGTDGSDVQWECKAEMSKAQRFGTVEVFCEGYDYPDDPYVLQGSCGLEYTLDLTGHQDAYDKQSSYSHYTKPKHKGSSFENLLYIGVSVFIFYVIYKSCMSSGRRDATGTGFTADYPDDPHAPSAPGWGGGGGFYGGGGPPPPGFRPDLGMDGGCGARPRGMGMGGYGGSGLGGGGFWTGAATGGFLGYLLGNRGGGTGTTGAWGYPQEGMRGSSYGFSTSSGSASSSGGAHSSSGFGGTRRR